MLVGYGWVDLCTCGNKTWTDCKWTINIISLIVELSVKFCFSGDLGKPGETDICLWRQLPWRIHNSMATSSEAGTVISPIPSKITSPCRQRALFAYWGCLIKDHTFLCKPDYLYSMVQAEGRTLHFSVTWFCDWPMSMIAAAYWGRVIYRIVPYRVSHCHFTTIHRFARYYVMMSSLLTT